VPLLPSRLSVSSRLALTHEFDLEGRIAAATPADTLKGMFFQRIIALGSPSGVRWPDVRLKHAPAGLRYTTFGDYPVADYFRLVHAVGRTLFPRVSSSEAMRRVGHRDFAEFAESKVGKVALSFTGNARATLSRAGTMYGLLLKGPTIDARETDDGVEIRYRKFPGPVEVYPIGTVESLCRYYRIDYQIDITIHGPCDADYMVLVAKK